MQKNIGNQEAYIRIGTGVVLLLVALFVTENATLRILLAAVAAILAGTAFVRACPINTLLKRNTYEEGPKETTEEEAVVVEAGASVQMPQETVIEEPKPAPSVASEDPVTESPMGSGMPMGGSTEATETDEEKEEEKQV